MKIGILTYHLACNFGANLQLLSTIGYLRQSGHTPVVINYVENELFVFYQNNTPAEEFLAFKNFRKEHFPLSAECYTPEDIAGIIKKENIDGVIIGSDAVAQHHPFLERIIFPTRHIISLRKMTSDRLFPNPFWGTFMDFLSNKVAVCAMSVSSQDSAFNLIPLNVKNEMKYRMEAFDYVSVRDSWTQKMYQTITKGGRIPKITPDPVFAFNQNVSKLLPNRDELLKKYNLPENYCLFSFLNNRTVSKKWLKEIEILLANKGYASVALTFPQGMKHDTPFKLTVETPLNPIDWYSLIKFSHGYIGHNMHPIVVALHNAVPFFSFDNYGTIKYRGYYADDSTSKIYHILSKAGFLTNRVSCINKKFIAPNPEIVIDRLLNFEREKATEFSNYYYVEYHKMMSEILSKMI